MADPTDDELAEVVMKAVPYAGQSRVSQHQL